MWILKHELGSKQFFTTVGQFPDISLTTVKFPDNSSFPDKVAIVSIYTPRDEASPIFTHPQHY